VPLRLALRSARASSGAAQASHPMPQPQPQPQPNSRPQPQPQPDSATQTAATASARAVVVLDLGAGTGSNLRFLAPRLGGLQCWHLTDHDVRLLVAARRETARWASARGGAPPPKASASSASTAAASTSAVDPPAATGQATDASVASGSTVDAARRPHAFSAAGADVRDGWSVDAIPLPQDLRALDRLPFDRANLVTASALLDLVGEAWLRELVVRCAAAGAAVLWSLDVDGRVRIAPADRADRIVLRDFARDARRDKGLGYALSSQAGRRAAALLVTAGYHVILARSDWRIGASQAAFANALLAGWAAAATAARPSRARIHAAWLRRRRESLMRRRVRILVGHTELVGWPRRARGA
jgi:hypothetical protein